MVWLLTRAHDGSGLALRGARLPRRQVILHQVSLGHDGVEAVAVVGDAAVRVALARRRDVCGQQQQGTGRRVSKSVGSARKV